VRESKPLSVVIAMAGLMFMGIVKAVALNTATIAFEKHGDQQVIEEIEERFN